MNEKKEEQVFGFNNDCSNQNNPIGFDQRSGLEFTGLNSALSNATATYVIDDFTIFNPYIHNNLGITR